MAQCVVHAREGLRAQQLNLSDTMGPKLRSPLFLLFYPRAFIFQVCNESALLVRDLGGPVFNAFARFPDVHLCPAELEAEIDEVSDFM